MESKQTLDESLYSRQLFTFGKDGMMSLKETIVLISNINGLGLEVAKCIILGGVKRVILHDENTVKLSDLSTNYYLTEQDVNKNRGEACVNKLKELNPYVDVFTISEKLDTKLLTKLGINILVLADYNLTHQLALNEFTHNNNIKMITCSTYGLFGQIFCDFGENFVIKDVDGEEIRTGVVTELKYHEQEKGTIIVTGNNHKMSYDDKIKIYATNMKESDAYYNKYKNLGILGEQQVIRVLSSSQLLIEKKIFNKKEDNLILQNVQYEQVKQSVKINFQPLKNALNQTSSHIVNMDFDSTKGELLHIIFRALNYYQEKYQELPKTYNRENAQVFQEICLNLAKNLDLKDEQKLKIINQISMTARGQLCPMQSVIGSIVAQEVMKASMKKYTPINQWLFFESLNCLPLDYIEQNSDNTSNLSEKLKRYEGQIQVFGREFQDKLLKSNIFVVGAGAIGCEHLKNFAMMGIGNIIITDMDIIEKSNLNRQFLFRSTHISKPKSVIASQEGMKLNNQVKITAQLNRVGHETLNIYNDKFFESVDCVANALDNVQARLFVDTLCVSHQKPLLESGTLGTSGNIQVIVPKLTESYGSQQDPPEQSIPVCTLKNFPYMPEHCVQWARELLESTFTHNIKNLNQYLKDPKFLKTMPPSEVNIIVPEIIKILDNLPKNYDDCIEFGFKLWHELFRDQIMNLLIKYPVDHKTDEGELFWSGTKKCPQVFDFDITDELHNNFVFTCANLWANVFGITHQKIKNNQVNKINKVLTSMKTSEFKVDTEELLKQLESYKNKFDKLKIEPVEFEKDDDSNYHIDFITSASNMRSRNYAIKELDRHKIKGIAGKIIPAIATTTSLVSGLVSLELYKILQNKNKLEDYRNYYVNMGISNFQYSEPAEVSKQKIGKLEFTLWDSFEFQNSTLQEVINYFDTKYNLIISGFTVGQLTLLSTFMPAKKQTDRKKMKFDQVYRELTNTEPENPLKITLIVEDEDEEELDMSLTELPTIKIKF